MLLKLEGVSIKKEQNTLLDNVSFTLNEEEILTLIGPNGAGKTTLVKAILGLIPITTGTIWKKPDLTIGYMPQKLHLNPLLPLNVMTFLKLVDPSSPLAWVEEVMQAAGIEKLENRDLQKLSGGEWQRVLLAQALLIKPQLLILDEPTQGVDVAGQGELYQRIQDVRERWGCGVILVSHDLHVVMSSSDTVICLNHHICCSGHPEAVKKNAKYQALFGLAPYTHHHDHSHD